MQLKTEERTVGGYTFTMTMLLATESRKVQVMLIRTLGPGLRMLGKKGLNEGAVGEALSGVLENLKDQDLDMLVAAMSRASRLQIDGKTPLVKDVYDLFFSGKAALHWLWLIESVKFQFEDFTNGDLDLSSLVSWGSPPQPTASPSPPE